MSRWLGDYDRLYREPETDSISTEKMKHEIISNPEYNDAEIKLHLMELAMMTGETIYAKSLSGAYRFRTISEGGGRVIMEYGQNMKYQSNREDEHPRYNVDGLTGTRPVYRFCFDTHDFVMGELENHGDNPYLTGHLYKSAIKDWKERKKRYITTTISDIDDFHFHSPILTCCPDLEYTALVMDQNPDRFFGIGSFMESSRAADYVRFTPLQQQFLSKCDAVAKNFGTRASVNWGRELRVKAVNYVLSYNAKVDRHVKGYDRHIRSCPDQIVIDQRYLYECGIDYDFLPFEKELAIFCDSFILASDEEREERFAHAMDLLTSDECPLYYKEDGRFGFILRNLRLKDGEDPRQKFLSDMHKVVMIGYGDIYYQGRRPSEVDFWSSNTYWDLIERAPVEIQERNIREYAEFMDKYGEEYEKKDNYSGYQKLESGYFQYMHGKPYKGKVPADAKEKIQALKDNHSYDYAACRELSRLIWKEENARREFIRNGGVMPEKKKAGFWK